ncbi:MAG: hypothetical protein OEY67_06975 [Gammaproteobacteria bacterium]|nr:hypothetical protein [Gammaproteobacteria bacterium]
MSVPKKSDALTTSGNPLPPLNNQQKESLIMMIVLHYAEEHALLNKEQIEDAKASLRALFLRATGEETMLRKIISILRVNKSLNQTFSDMTHVLEGIHKARKMLSLKLDKLKQHIGTLAITVQENTDFAGPFLEFSEDFLRSVLTFERQMSEYREVRENEARAAHTFRLAQEARNSLKHRFENHDSVESEHEKKVKEKVYQHFDFSEAETDYHYTQRSAKHAEKEITALLNKFQQMCQMAMKPEMRTPDPVHHNLNKPEYPDIYTMSSKAMRTYPKLKVLVPSIQELLRLYQHSYGIFHLDFEKFNRAIVPMIENIEDYLQAKEMDEDVRTKQKKLEKIESLIAFLDAAAILLKDGQQYAYPQFSSTTTKLITHTTSKWSGIAEDLLRMKVTAEAELSTQLS